MSKAAEVKFPLSYAGPGFSQDQSWRERRTSEWEGPMEWRYTAASSSSLIDQLKEKFRDLEMRGRELAGKWEQIPWMRPSQLMTAAPIPPPQPSMGATAAIAGWRRQSDPSQPSPNCQGQAQGLELLVLCQWPHNCPELLVSHHPNHRCLAASTFMA